MSSPAVFPAKTSAQRVAVQGLPEHVADFGTRCFALLAKYDLALSSPKTRRTCVLADLSPFSTDLPTWGILLGGVCWELGTSVRRTDGNVCGSLPTPTARLYGNNRGGGAGRTGKVRPSLESLAGGIRLSLREWMMGWPIGWTELDPLATARFRRWLHLHGEC
jgi:hypothetical protein